MKPYGVPRESGVEFPDVADIQHYAMKSSVGRIKENGNQKGYIRHSVSKQKARRVWKRRARIANLKEVANWD